MNKRAGENKKKKQKTIAKEAMPSIPPELLLRRDTNIRYERSGIIYATDGRVGTLKQIVVDDTSGEVTDLIIIVDESERTILFSPDLVDKTAGSAVFLLVNRTQFAERAANAPDFERKHFAKVDVAGLASKFADRPRIPRRSVIEGGRDYVETPITNPLERLERRPAPAQPPVPVAPSAPEETTEPAKPRRRAVFGRPSA